MDYTKNIQKSVAPSESYVYELPVFQSADIYICRDSITHTETLLFGVSKSNYAPYVGCTILYDGTYKITIQNEGSTAILLDEIQYYGAPGRFAQLNNLNQSSYEKLYVGSNINLVNYNSNNIAPVINNKTYPHIHLNATNVSDAIDELDDRIARCGRTFSELEFGAGKDIDILDDAGNQITMNNYVIGSIIYRPNYQAYYMLLYTFNGGNNNSERLRSVILKSIDGISWTKFADYPHYLLTDMKCNEFLVCVAGFAWIMSTSYRMAIWGNNLENPLNGWIGENSFSLDEPLDYSKLKYCYASLDMDANSILLLTNDSRIFSSNQNHIRISVCKLTTNVTERPVWRWQTYLFSCLSGCTYYVKNIRMGQYCIYTNYFRHNLSDAEGTPAVFCYISNDNELLVRPDRGYTYPNIKYINKYFDNNNMIYMSLQSFDEQSHINNGVIFAKAFVDPFGEIISTQHISYDANYYDGHYPYCVVGKCGNIDIILTPDRYEYQNIRIKTENNNFSSSNSVGIKDGYRNSISFANTLPYTYINFHITQLLDKLYIYSPSYNSSTCAPDGNAKLYYSQVKM